MAEKVSTAIILFKKRKKKNGKYPVKLRLTQNRKQIYYSVDNNNRVYEFTEEEFKKITSPKPRGEFKHIHLELSIIEEKAQKIIRSFEDFSFDKFKTHFGSVGSDLRNVYYYLDMETQKFKETTLGIKKFRPTKSALILFTGKTQHLDFRDITEKKLQEFEKYLREVKGLKPSTIFGYISSVRMVFYRAIQDNAIPAEMLPFGRGKYKVPSYTTAKRALKLADIEKLYKYKPEPHSHEAEALDLWMFTYLCNGINMKDLCHLKYKDIDSDFIIFIRKKTENSARITKPISVPITDDVRKILKRQGNTDKSPNNYVFPFIDDTMDIKRKMYRIAWTVRKTNVNMQRIGKKLGITDNITTYTARHSFATVLKRSGVSIAFISESLGHSDLSTTETYLDSFLDDQKKEVAKYLTTF